MKKILFLTLFTFISSLLTVNAQIITTVAGTGITGYNGDNILATSAKINMPQGIVTDAAGNFYFADYLNYRIRKVNVSTGIITTVAGGGASHADNISATLAAISPAGICLDTSGNIYIADWNYGKVRKVIVSTGIITSVAGNGTLGYNGDNISALSAQLHYPYDVALDDSGNIYIADSYNSRIRKVTIATGIITTVAGTGVAGYNGDNILATAAEINVAYGVAVDSIGNIYIADQNARIRKVTNATGIITTVAGTGNFGYNGDNILATAADISTVGNIAFDRFGNFYFPDWPNERVRKVTASTGIITTIAGTGAAGYNGDNILATTAEIHDPWSVAVDTFGNVYISEQQGMRIRKITNCTNIQTPALTATGDTSFCIGGSLSLSPGSFYSYSWNTGSTTQTITIDSANTYRVTVTNLNGCTATDSVVVTVFPNPTATIFGGDSLCAGDSLLLDAGFYSHYIWSNGDTTAINFIHTAGTYSVTITDSHGCTGTAAKTVTVNPLPQPVIIASGATTFCQGDSVVLNVGVFAAYHWSTLSSNQAITVRASGTYTVTVTTAYGCTATASQVVTVNALPVVTSAFHADTTKGCSPLTISFINTSSNGTSYLWNFGDNSTDTAKNPSHTYTDSGTYTITLITTNTGPCGIVKDTMRRVDYISVNVFKPVAAFTSDYLLPIYTGDSIHFKDLSYDATGGIITLWQWWFGDGQGSNFINPIHEWDLAGMYRVLLVVTNNQGCKDSTFYDYIDVMEGILDIPNVFTPNNDGFNDYFEIKASGMKTYNLEIFNRWGMLIFESNSPNIQWDGYNQAGIQCADGTYYYVLKASSYSGKEYGRAGFVTLIR